MDLTFDHGRAWASMVDKLHDEFIANNLYPAVRIAAGYDSEYYQNPEGDCRNPNTGHRGCNSPVSLGADQWTLHTVNSDVGTLNWEQGYNIVQYLTNHRPLYNFGSCEDCKRIGDPTITIPTDPRYWNANDMEAARRAYHLTYELYTARAVPQIYQAPKTYEWYNVRWYAWEIQTDLMYIDGTMSQVANDACPLPSGRLTPSFGAACLPRANTNGGQTDCDPQWMCYQCISNPCPQLPPNRSWQALSDMLSAPYTPERNLNLSLPLQTVLNYNTLVLSQN